MSKFRVVILVIAAVALFALAGCTTATVIEDGCTVINGDRFCRDGSAATTTAETEAFTRAEGTTPAEAEDDDLTIVPLTIDPAEEAAEEGADAPDFGTCDVEDLFSSYRDNPYGLIDFLDEQNFAVYENRVPYTLDAVDGCILFWTGNYKGSDLSPFVANGNTGTFLLMAGDSVRVSSVGSWIYTGDIDMTVSVTTEVDIANGAMDADLWIEALNDMHDRTADLITWADAQVNVDDAPDLAARYRFLGPAEYKDLTPASAIFWVRPGSIQGEYVTLSENAEQGIGVYLVAGTSIKLTHAHTGVQLDRPINPEADLDYWKK
jgi:hypothetical protein